MQVAHQNDHVTHAVIGGKQSIEFSISNSAEFFNILSSTLYKDQILAVVREVLCNAWDAHIEAGCTDRPVQVTITSDSFVIKDFGKGIHLDDMGLIYGTYGNSTKKNDGNQTGGFGLGCKAPFAYTDHFEVTSCNDGIKTIYNLSKSSAQAMGKPGIIPIASFPTEESGLTVSIRIKSSDMQRFHALAKRIICNGDMNMHLNGKQVDTIGFDMNKGNFLITNNVLLDTGYRIMVRYGNVIYPVDSAEGIGGECNAIIQHMDTLTKTYGQFSIVFQAPPHSISVTPSRESLSMQEHTISTLKGLFGGFLDSLKTEFAGECSKYAEEITAKAVTASRIDELLDRSPKLPSLHDTAAIHQITDLSEMAKAYMHNNYPKGLGYRKEDIARRLTQMVKANLVNRGKVDTFLLAMKDSVKEVPTYKGWGERGDKSSWLQRQVLAPLLSKLLSAGMETSTLYVCDAMDLSWEGSNRDKTPPLVPATKARPLHLMNTLPYLRNIIVITSRKDDLISNAYAHETFKKLGRYHGFLVYYVGRKKGEKEAARTFFAKQNVVVVDLTLEENNPTKEQTIRAPRVPAKKGIVQLSFLINGVNTSIYTGRTVQDNATRIEDPEFTIKIPSRGSYPDYHFEGWNPKTSYYITELFGAKGGVVTTTAMEDKWAAKGAKTLIQYVAEKLYAYMYNNPHIEEFYSMNSSNITEKLSNNERIVELIYSNAVLKKEFGLESNITEEDKKYLAIFREMHNKHYYTKPDELNKVIAWVNSIKPAPATLALIPKLKNPLLSMIDVYQVTDMLKESKNTVQTDKILDVVRSIING